MDTATYKNVLEKERELIKSELKTLGIHNPQVESDWTATPPSIAENDADTNSNADRAEEWIERRAILSDLEARYNNLNLALDKITNGTFGTCEICQKEVETDRLEVNPAARTCKTHINDEADLNN